MEALLRIPDRPAAFVAALEGLTRLNERLMSDAAVSGQAAPSLYRSGVRYRREPREVWKHWVDTLADGWGDCEDLAAWRAAELRASGVDPKASVTTYKSAPRTWHAVVVRGDGQIEDPSRKLGMKSRKPGPRTLNDIPDRVLLGEDFLGDGAGEPPAPRKVRPMNDVPIRISPGLCGLLPANLRGDDEDPNDEPGASLIPDPTPEDDAVTTDAEPEGDGYRGAARIPLATGRAIMTASSIKPSPEAAASAALNLASKALDSKAARLLLPPQAKLALQLIRSPQARAIGKKLFKVGRWGFKRLRKR